MGHTNAKATLDSDIAGGASTRAGVEVLNHPTADPDVVRLFHRGEGDTVDIAAERLQQALTLIPDGATPAVLVTGAGFAWAELPGGTRRRYPTSEEHAEVVATATRTAEALRAALPSARPLVVAGVDVWAWPHGSEDGWAVGQFAAVIPAGDAPVTLFPKRFPVAPNGEEAYLRVPDPEDGPPVPGCDTPRGRAAVLVCHDLNVYHARSVAVTSRPERRAWRECLTGQIETMRPAFGLHLAHYVETERSFGMGFGGWRGAVGVPLFGAAGLPDGVEQDRARELADSLTSAAGGWSVLDLIERRRGPA